MLGLLSAPRMLSPEKLVSTIKKQVAEVAGVDIIKEKNVSTVKKSESEVVPAVDVKYLRPILLLLSGTMKFFLEKMGSIIKKLESEVVGGADTKDLRGLLHFSVGTVKFLSEKIRSIIRFPGTKIIGVADVHDLIAMLMSLGGTLKFLSESGVVGVDIKNLRAMFKLLVGTMKVLSEKMGIIIKIPTVEVVGMEIKDLSRDGVTYNAKIAVGNPFIIPIPIGEISYTLKSDDRMIVAGKMGKAGWMTAKEKTVLEVPLRVAHAILLTLMKDIGADGDIDYQLDLGVTIVSLPIFGDITIPLSWKGEIKLPTIFSIF